MVTPTLPDGNLIVQGCTVAQLFDLMKLAAREVLAESKQATELASEATDLPDEVPAAMAAKFCNYATGKSLRKWHGNGLTVIRNGKRLYYKKEEVVKLKKKLFNL